MVNQLIKLTVATGIFFGLTACGLDAQKTSEGQAGTPVETETVDISAVESSSANACPKTANEQAALAHEGHKHSDCTPQIEVKANDIEEHPGLILE